MIPLFFALTLVASPPEFTLARVRYAGGGDWYNDPEILPNLARELRNRLGVPVDTVQHVVSLADPALFQYPFLFLTGHGNLRLSDQEIQNLRRYLDHGGFLYADDDFGMDKAFRREIRRVFPDAELRELPPDHPLFHVVYDLRLPKIHEHYPGPPHAYGIFRGGRLVVLYTYNTNISDGWTPRHKDPPEKREQAFKMGINIVAYALLY